MADWQCLTADLRGSEQVRHEYIRASSEASRLFGISPAILVGIKRTESGLGLNPQVSNNNRNGTTDRGFYQVNAEVWLPEIQRVGGKVSETQLHDVRRNAIIAAWILRRKLNRIDIHGTLEAVGYYHRGGGTDAKAKRIRQIYKDKFMTELKALGDRCG